MSGELDGDKRAEVSMFLKMLGIFWVSTMFYKKVFFKFKFHSFKFHSEKYQILKSFSIIYNKNKVNSFRTIFQKVIKRKSHKKLPVIELSFNSKASFILCSCWQYELKKNCTPVLSFFYQTDNMQFSVEGGGVGQLLR